ncbi:winged helix-turn-helix transcriptional regulator [Kitasatospora sp. NPDC090091]|uniref:winged helix-turn-helix transcriptional regulator n=1 Tax=Kitasatospora sp. NPDC090091 TaxID=3364081 RepID=UPI00382D2F8B
MTQTALTSPHPTSLLPAATTTGPETAGPETSRHATTRPATAAAPLSADFFDPACPVGTLPVLGGKKWTWKLMRCLEGGPRRFSELRVPLVGITAKVLAESLRAMEQDGVVSRTEYDENPPRVEYALTPLGRSLLGPMDAVCEWSRANLATLLEAREAYEREERGGARAEWPAGSISATAGAVAAGGRGTGPDILDA